jgi:heme exporter protein C
MAHQAKPTALRWSTFSAPSRFYALAGTLTPWCWVVSVLTGLAGLYVGLWLAPTDATQHDAYRVIFIHVPAAILSMIIYMAMAFWAAWGWIFNARMASMYARALAPTGALLTFVTLWTGSLWGKPTWGTWWIWDARITSYFILLLLYIGYIALTEAIDDVRRSAHAGALLALVGVVNIPIIYFSVKWWNTLHQGQTIKMSGTSMEQTMQWSMWLMMASFWAYAFAMAFTRSRAIVLEQESDTEWVKALA